MVRHIFASYANQKVKEKKRNDDKQIEYKSIDAYHTEKKADEGKQPATNTKTSKSSAGSIPVTVIFSNLAEKCQPLLRSCRAFNQLLFYEQLLVRIQRLIGLKGLQQTHSELFSASGITAQRRNHTIPFLHK